MQEVDTDISSHPSFFLLQLVFIVRCVKWIFETKISNHRPNLQLTINFFAQKRSFTFRWMHTKSSFSIFRYRSGADCNLKNNKKKKNVERFARLPGRSVFLPHTHTLCARSLWPRNKNSSDSICVWFYRTFAFVNRIWWFGRNLCVNWCSPCINRNKIIIIVLTVYFRFRSQFTIATKLLQTKG